jgi:hypothetical protein
MSSATKPGVLNEGVIQILERLMELRTQRDSTEDPTRRASIRDQIHELQWVIAPVLEPWIKLIAKAGLFEIQVQVPDVVADGEDEYLRVNDTYMLSDPDYLPLFVLVTKPNEGGSIRE